MLAHPNVLNSNLKGKTYRRIRFFSALHFRLKFTYLHSLSMQCSIIESDTGVALIFPHFFFFKNCNEKSDYGEKIRAHTFTLI